MRRTILVLALLLSPVAAQAQGRIIPRPCLPNRPCPPPCPDVRCRRDLPDIERRSSNVEVELRDGVLHYEVEETFLNRGGGVGEADYLFPLPKNAAFEGLKLEINGELVAGETMSADEARRIYEDIVRRSRDPALVEWMGHGLLRTRIFPIAAGETRRIVVRFHAVAEREGDALRVDYFRGTQPNAAADVARDRKDPEGRLRFRLSYPREQYGRPYSPTHDVRVEEERGLGRVDLSGGAREMTLLLPLRRGSRAAISVLSHAPGREDGFALITLSPPAIAPRSTPRDVTLVLDVSGSMSGKKIQQAREAGKQLLATLTPRDRFRLIDFSSDVRAFRDEMLFATRTNVAAAERYLDGLRAEGSTNISGALEEALSLPAESGRLPLVLFVTDGEPTVGERDPERIAQQAGSERGRRRIFTFGVGADLNVALLERLALEGRGTAHFVRPDESVERAVSIVASRLTSPVATDLRVRVEGARLSKMHPAGPYDLFAGQDLVVLARYEGSGTILVRFEGESSEGRVSWSTETELPDRDRENGFVARLWATQRVGYLSAERRRNGPSQEIDDEIRALGERYGIPTELTSYLVLEPGAVVARGQVGQGGNLRGLERSRRIEPRAQAFEEAKAASAMRGAQTLTQADAASAAPEAAAAGITLRRVGTRTFVLRDSVWTDTRFAEGTRVVKVKAYSEAYFALVREIPDLSAAFALGEQVLVRGTKVAVAVAPDGAEQLSGSDLAAIVAAW
ncbi:MAG TPA: VIT domain-containing protein [Gemmatimonadaceae bacterium]|nr:VIT domain-containing protein [Gemmatimonadaceae bacterium]